MKCTVVHNEGKEIPTLHLKKMAKTANALHDQYAAHATLWDNLMTVQEAYKDCTKEGEVDMESVMWACLSNFVF